MSDNYTDHPDSAEPENSKPEKSKPAENSQSPAEAEPASNAHWQQDLINRLAFASLNEQRRARRWSTAFKVLTLLYFGVFLFFLMSTPSSKWESGKSVKHTALIDVEGVIAANSPANADAIVHSLREAFKEKHSTGIILRINSPGGSPVQAGYIYDEIKRLREKHKDKKVIAVAGDLCASAAYYIAAAADEIYADKASIVGSIGVLINGFGFEKAMDKLGVERRLLTAGEHKGLLDPFSPMVASEKKHVQSMLNGVHQQFIKAVTDGRGDRLKKDAPGLFSGLFWDGEKGLQLGLVDGLGSAGYVAREILGEEKIVDYTVRPNFLDRFADRLGASIGSKLSSQLGLNAGSIQLH